jgi:hypothetical protein
MSLIKSRNTNDKYVDTGYFTSGNEPGVQPTIHQEEKPDIYRLHIQVYVPMYCGLHFIFRWAHYHS